MGLYGFAFTSVLIVMLAFIDVFLWVVHDNIKHNKLNDVSLKFIMLMFIQFII